MKDQTARLLRWLGYECQFTPERAPRMGRVVGAALFFIVLYILLGTLVRLVQAIALDDHEAIRNLGFLLAALLGAPFVVWRSFVAQQQADTGEQGLITDRINKAVEGLGAEKEVNRLGRNVRWRMDGANQARFEWMDEPLAPPEHDAPGSDGKVPLTNDPWTPVALTVPNLEVRLGAIYALERIAQDSDRDHVRIMEILCAYIRENAPASGARDHSLGDWPDWPENADDGTLQRRAEELDKRRADLNAWVSDLRYAANPRTDIQAALDVIGRRIPRQIEIEKATKTRGSQIGYRLDLRGTNLQAVDLTDLDFARSMLAGSRLDGAILERTVLDEADLHSARLCAANLRGARLQLADLTQVGLEGAALAEAILNDVELFEGQLQTADFSDAHLDCSYLGNAGLEGANLSQASLRRASLYRAQLQHANLNNASLEGVDFGDADLEGADLTGARLHGANFRSVHMSRSTNLTRTSFRGAALMAVDFGTLDRIPEYFADRLAEAFGDASVTLPPNFGLTAGEGRLAHWSTERFTSGSSSFQATWHAHQRRIGYTRLR